MLNKPFTILLTLLLSTAATAAPNKCGTVSGNMETGKVSLQCMNITGSLTANNTTFTGKIQLTGGPAKLFHANLQDVEAFPDKTHKKVYIYLNDNTVINGNITFPKGNGIVVNHDSKILGKVIGGVTE